MTTRSQALVPGFFSWNPSDRVSSAMKTGGIVGAGVVFLALMAQVVIPLPFTPVPVTGQTFAVTLIALTLGRKLALPTVLAYLGIGAAGLPVFAAARAGLGGPTTGYLMGMIASAFIVGKLAEMGFAKSFTKAMAAAVLSDALIFSFGLVGLSFYLPTDQIWMAGLIPFIPGQVIKAILAASLVSTFSKKSAV